MRYVSIDIETTGLNPETCQILSIGAVIEDTNNILPLDELPTFHAAIKRDKISGDIYAINMNSNLISIINTYNITKTQDEKEKIASVTGMDFFDEDEIAKELYYFLYVNGLCNARIKDIDGHHVMMHSKHGTVPVLHRGNKIDKVVINVAGKNFGTFDKLFLERLYKWNDLIKINNRILDPAILCVDWKSDDALPNLTECKRRSNIGGEVTHNAIEDAMDVIEVLRKNYY